MARVLGVLILAIGLTLSLGCGNLVQRATEKAVEKATGVETSKDKDSVTIKGKDGENVTITSKVPDELKNFPVPSGFQSTEGGSMSSGADKLAVATWKGKSTLDKVMEFYKTTMPGQGWKEASAFTAGDGGMISYTKDPDQSLTLTISSKSGDIEISALLGKSPQR